MPVPKKRMSHARKNRRRAQHDRLNSAGFVLCSNEACKKPIMPHRTCPHCGFYNGLQVVEIKEKKAKEEKPAK